MCIRDSACVIRGANVQAGGKRTMIALVETCIRFRSRKIRRSRSAGFSLGGRGECSPAIASRNCHRSGGSDGMNAQRNQPSSTGAVSYTHLPPCRATRPSRGRRAFEPWTAGRSRRRFPPSAPPAGHPARPAPRRSAPDAAGRTAAPGTPAPVPRLRLSAGCALSLIHI